MGSHNLAPEALEEIASRPIEPMLAGGGVNAIRTTIGIAHDSVTTCFNIFRDGRRRTDATADLNKL